MRPDGPSLLLINPWIHDFAAYDFFAAPLGLLSLAGLLRDRGFAVHLLDCLDGPRARPGPYGTGRYAKEILPTPPGLGDLPRRYGRYGVSPAPFRAQLSRLAPPDAVLVTSLMTYWHPGVAEAICLVRERFPAAPVILGGVYATLCPDHARRASGADLVISGPGEAPLLAALADITGVSAAPPDPEDLDVLPYPALDLLPRLSFLPLLTSRGCPFACDYCASPLLQPRYRRRSPPPVVEELLFWQRRLDLEEVAFYDDALLVGADSHLFVILEELARRGAVFRFHTPNALHARGLTRQAAGLLKAANFATVRLAVETTAVGDDRPDRKLARGELEEALANLHEAGFRRGEVGVYLLVGLPGQEEAEVTTSIRRVRELGGRPLLAYYSPLPGTALWPRAAAASRYDLAADPLFHNNSLMPCWPEFSWERLTRLQRLCRE
ncbi:MAG: radical SAM protein [Deltaproteobacteria bacterium]|nr:radical SAM protein [Deltaproteobacteria bacterium]